MGRHQDKEPARMPSFRGRLTLEVTALCLAVLAAATGAVFLGTRHALRANLDRTLLSIARTEIASSLDGPYGRIHVHNEVPDLLDLPSGEGYEKFAQIEDEHGHLIARTTNLDGGPPLSPDDRHAQLARHGRASFADLHRGAQTCRALYYPLQSVVGKPWVALVAIPKMPLDRSLVSLALILGLSLMLAGGAAAWGADRLSRRLTRPLEGIAASARVVGAGNFAERIPDDAPDRELRDVTAGLNRMLDRLEAAITVQQDMVAAQRRFVADASHEMRSPLASLRGTVEVAMRRPRTGEEYQETLQVCLSETQRLGRLVEDLLTLSRADAGRFSFRFAPVDVSEVAARSAAAHAAQAEAAGVSLALHAAPGLTVCADADRLRQAMDNLLDNALQYAPPGSAVTLSAGREGGSVRVCVADDGPGLSSEEQARVFDRFYRADRARSRQSGGLGLGLSIVKAIVEAHDGTVGVTSATGAGAAFWFAIPALP